MYKTFHVTERQAVQFRLSAFNWLNHPLEQFSGGNQLALQGINAELQKSNLELEQRRRYMEAVLANVTAGIISVDKDGLLTTVNKSAEKLLLINLDKVSGHNFREVLRPEHLDIVKGLLLLLLVVLLLVYYHSQ